MVPKSGWAEIEEKARANEGQGNKARRKCLGAKRKARAIV